MIKNHVIRICAFCIGLLGFVSPASAAWTDFSAEGLSVYTPVDFATVRVQADNVTYCSSVEGRLPTQAEAVSLAAKEVFGGSYATFATTTAVDGNPGYYNAVQGTTGTVSQYGELEEKRAFCVKAYVAPGSELGLLGASLSTSPEVSTGVADVVDAFLPMILTLFCIGLGLSLLFYLFRRSRDLVGTDLGKFDSSIKQNNPEYWSQMNVMKRAADRNLGRNDYDYAKKKMPF